MEINVEEGRSSKVGCDWMWWKQFSYSWERNEEEEVKDKTYRYYDQCKNIEFSVQIRTLNLHSCLNYLWNHFYV